MIDPPVISDDDEPHTPGPMIVDPVIPEGRAGCPHCVGYSGDHCAGA